jgi:phosphatidylserine decarboxylase
MPLLPVAPDGWSVLWKLLVLAAVFAVFDWGSLSWVALILAGFTLFFFRDPDRDVPTDPDLALSPADGTVMRVEDVAEDEFIGGPAKRVSIFLSVFNVHINRSPVTGTVKWVQYRAGKMLAAYKTEASTENERNSLGIEGRDGRRVVVHQVTGLIARRIVCSATPGTRLAQGQRFGLIKFGSCTELLVPASAMILVQSGDKVQGGLTALARFTGADGG